MVNDILVFRGNFGDFVDYRSYSGRIPPEISSISLEGEDYSLSLYEYMGSKYLIAHQDKMKSDALEEAILEFKPTSIN